jgi:uncharacterized protein (TIGR03089 family)
VDDVWGLLTARRRASPGLPLVTHLDQARRERTELSATSVENAAAKIANALRDEFDLDVGSTVGLALPLHWQRTTWCAGVWTAGAIVVAGDAAADADLVVAGPVEAALLAGRTAGDVMVVSLHPFGLPHTDPLPPGTSDVTLAVRQQPDAYLHDPPNGGLAALRGHGSALLTQQEVLDLARRRATEWRLERGGRLLVDDRTDPLDSWLAALAVPLVADASVLLVSGDDDESPLTAHERATAISRP